MLSTTKVGKTIPALAHDFGVSEPTICCALRGIRATALGCGRGDIIRNGTDAKIVTEAAFKKIKAILAGYPIEST